MKTNNIFTPAEIAWFKNCKKEVKMKFTFEYKETLSRKIVIEDNTFAKALAELERKIEKEEIVLGPEDFVGGEIIVPLGDNYLPQLQYCETDVEDNEDYNLVVDLW